ncbi:unnamed protein product [Larinioides sclopetarius]|uniref:Transposable element P transposase n=1 Tax=Larinioides sclopetarius TaxID=280406 RepID=A0AAV2B245_9ARAC
MTIASLYGLYEDLMPLDVKFILTSRLNQDCLENFFFQIRGVGHFYDHPLPSEVKYRIRLLLLGKNVDDIPFSSATNTLPCEDKSLLTTELLLHMSPDINKCGNQSEIHEIITNEVSSSELTAIVDSSECLNDFSPDCSAEGLKYLAGYIAHKCRKYDRSLAIPSGQSLAISSKRGLKFFPEVAFSFQLMNGSNRLKNLKKLLSKCTFMSGIEQSSNKKIAIEEVNIFGTLKSDISK